MPTTAQDATAQHAAAESATAEPTLVGVEPADLDTAAGGRGLVSFVGAGPGAADLLTLRGANRLAAADIVIWASSLVPEALLGHASPAATVLDSAEMTLEDVLAVYAGAPESRIVRLHSGDPSLYGAIQEQLDWCIAAERRFEIVPGVSALAAAAAVAGRELTIPGVSQSVILTRLAARTSASTGPGESVAALAAHGLTMGVFLSAARPGALQEELEASGAGYAPDTPACVVVRATWPDQQIHWTTVSGLAATLRSTGATTTVLVLVGNALTAAPRRSHLYDPGFAHAHRRRSLPGSTQGRPVPRRRR